MFNWSNKLKYIYESKVVNGQYNEFSNMQNISLSLTYNFGKVINNTDNSAKSVEPRKIKKWQNIVVLNKWYATKIGWQFLAQRLIGNAKFVGFSIFQMHSFQTTRQQSDFVWFSLFSKFVCDNFWVWQFCNFFSNTQIILFYNCFFWSSLHSLKKIKTLFGLYSLAERL